MAKSSIRMKFSSKSALGRCSQPGACSSSTPSCVAARALVNMVPELPVVDAAGTVGAELRPADARLQRPFVGRSQGAPSLSTVCSSSHLAVGCYEAVGPHCSCRRREADPVAGNGINERWEVCRRLAWQS